MALATTCPHCKTSFKVVADQLKLRRGLVRCGKCQEVFSGVDYLRYIDDPVPRAAAPASPGAQRSSPARDPAAPDPVAGDAAPARPSTPPVPPPPAAPGLDELKTAFFLPETIFGGTTAHEAIEIQAPMPAYIPSPEQAPGSAARPPVPGPQPAASPPPPSSGPDEGTGPSAAEMSQTQPSDSEDPDADFREPTGSAFEPSVSPPAAEPALPSDGLPARFAEAANEDALSGDFEQAALRLSRLPEGMDLEPQRSRPEPSPALPLGISPTTGLPEPANGDQFVPATGDGEREQENAAPKEQVDGEAEADNEPEADAVAKAGPARRRFPGAALLAGLLLVLALAQGVITARNELAVQFPMIKDTLVQWLQPLGLKVELPRRYDAVTIESFELQAGEPVAGEIQPYLAQALLRNQSSHPVQWPAIELSLTDPAGQLLARKVLLPPDYLGGEPREQGFAARSERTVRIRLGLNQITPNGYSAVLFYP